MVVTHFALKYQRGLQTSLDFCIVLFLFEIKYSFSNRGLNIAVESKIACETTINSGLIGHCKMSVKPVFVVCCKIKYYEQNC